MDVGGGSTEINFLHDGELRKSMSFNIGTVRLLSGKVKEQEWARMNEGLTDIASGHEDITIIGSGGNINKLYRLATDKDDTDKSFPVAELARLYHLLKPMDVRERMARFDLKPDRADVIIPAAEIFLNVASVVGARRIMVPVFGGAEDELKGNRG